MMEDAPVTAVFTAPAAKLPSSRPERMKPSAQTDRPCSTPSVSSAVPESRAAT